MAYFPAKKILFIHIPKNAGKSIECAMGLADPQDLGRVGKRSFLNRLLTCAQRRTANGDVLKWLHGSMDRTLCAQHLTLQEIQGFSLLPHPLESIRIFAVCRNPWARAFSSFKHFVPSSQQDRESFEAFCLEWFQRPSADYNVLAHKRRQLDYVLDVRGKPAVDRILRFEHLAAEFSQLNQEWNLGAWGLPHLGRQGGGDYRAFYTEKAKDAVAQYFSEDLEFFEYEF